jgi:hypothetical protein
MNKEKVPNWNDEEITEYVTDLSYQIKLTVRKYLSLPFFEQLEKVRNDVLHCQERFDQRNSGKRKKKDSQLTIVKILDELKKDLTADAEEFANHKDYERHIQRFEGKVRVLINSQFISGMFDAYFRFMFIQALIGNGTHILNLEYRKKLKAEFDLIQQSQFKNALFEILNPAFLLAKKDEDITNFWTDDRCLELLAKYNRLSLIIKNVRKVFKKDRNLKKELQENYSISDDWIDRVVSSENVKALALEWALNLMDIEKAMEEFFALRKSKSGQKKKL